MKICSTIAELRAALQNHRRQGQRIGFVPTMGNLHAGHISLINAAKQQAGCVVASIFVNRLQFGPNEDFDTYPRTFEADCQQLVAAGVDFLFSPTETVLYPEAQTYVVDPPEIQHLLEGACRPGHFRGVATVVMKLFQIVQPDVALFGKKDYQQLMVIRNMVDQFMMPIEIIGIDTLRAADGLALSSRNGYLNAAERIEAPRLQQVLQQVRQAILDGARDFDALCQKATETLDAHGWKTDYISIRKQSDLTPAHAFDGPLVIVAASKLGTPRLLDNLEV